MDSENNDENKVSKVSNSQFVHPQLKERGSACVYMCLPAKLYKQNQETCRHGRLMHACKGFSEKLCDGSPAPRVYACLRKGAVGGGWREEEGGDDRRPGGTETSVADSTPLSFYYQIIHDKHCRRLAKVRRAGRRGEWEGRKTKRRRRKSGDMSEGGHPGAANIASVMQHVCVASNVTFT